MASHAASARSDAPTGGLGPRDTTTTSRIWQVAAVVAAELLATIAIDPRDGGPDHDVLRCAT